MGNICKSQKDTEFEDTQQLQTVTLETGIKSINSTIQANSQQLNLIKESTQEGVQISNIQMIMIKPRSQEEGIKIMRDLLKFGNKIIIIPKVREESSNVSSRSPTKKGRLKNKGTQVTNFRLHSYKQQKD
ncbi:unnamed protein product (macronuclear) [Paramecium tetraurelia]|uniref:Uncharacterized protein n=1 Tax=Paramecium tetraurelia TaxID=5888 RepID=A0BVQ7_PARTE|nr:uncharacterized protein GSPATT00032476001 [Paramecium tetraurelia]CAK62624.1 unnamed protein product [Paramecium tetraurelia]|eukprot:XP_001430022.1 hypothetical protein (macronuclear) [Paramecium tetraurelia strain d4-2]